MDNGSIDTLGSWTMITENVFRNQLIRVGYRLWDDFIYPLHSTLMGANDDESDTQEELLSMAPVIKNAMHAVRRMILDMGERCTGRYARTSRDEGCMKPIEKAVLSCMKRDMDVRYVEFVDGVSSIEYALEEIGQAGVNRSANSYRRMLNVVETWYARVNSLHVVPTSAMQTADYMEERYGVVAQRSGEIPRWVNQVILNVIITSLLQNRKNDDVVFRQAEGGVLIEYSGVSASGVDSLGMWRPDRGMQDVLHLVRSLCAGNDGTEKASLIYASKVGHGSRFSITWDAACEFNFIPSGWYSIKYSDSAASKGQLFVPPGRPEMQDHLSEGTVSL